MLQYQKNSNLQCLESSVGAHRENTRVLAEYKQKEDIHERLRQLVEGSNQVGVNSETWQELDTNWQKVSAQVRHWQWLLDTGLPGDFGQIGEWLNQGEALIYGDDIPTQLNEEAAAVLNQKIEDHKSFFQDTESVQKQFISAMRHSPLVHQIPREQIESIDSRLQSIGPKADMRAVKLKFLLAGTLPELQEWPVKFRDFEVEHDYLPCYENGPQARIRRRGRHGKCDERPEARGNEGVLCR